MEIEEEMIEEHLDEEYQNSEIDEDLAEVETQIAELERKQAGIKNEEFHKKLEKVITLLRLHVQNYQRIIIFNRRRAKQRLRKRQCTLRNFFLQSLMEMQIRFVEMLPLAVEPNVFLDYMKNQETIEYDIIHNRDTDEDGESEEGGGLGFYEDIVANFTEDQWLDTFHMPKGIFTLICTKLKSSLEVIDMNSESLVAMCIYTLSTGASFRSVGMLFNVDHTFVRSALYKFVECFLNEFYDILLIMPKSNQELDEIAKGFQRASNMTPCAVGVLSVFELPTFSYGGDYKSYGMDRVIVQICIDNRLRFRKVEVAHHKPSMFLRSPNDISTVWKKLPDNTTIPYFLVAPALYPLRTWLMQKYENPCEPWEHDFNKSLDHLNIFREVSLQRLFGRWKILTSNEFIEPESKSLIVKTCCALHNLLEDSGDLYSEEWSSSVDISKYNYNVDSNLTMCYNDSGTAILKRDVIAKLIQTSNSDNID